MPTQVMVEHLLANDILDQYSADMVQCQRAIILLVNQRDITGLGNTFDFDSFGDQSQLPVSHENGLAADKTACLSFRILVLGFPDVFV